MTYLAISFVAPALGVYPYMLIANAPKLMPPIILFITLFLVNLGIAIMIIAMAYSVVFFGAMSPDRVIKHNLIHLLLRGSFNVVENTDFSGLSGSFTDSNQSATLMLELSANHIHVDIGSGFPSGLLPDYVQVFHDALTEADELLNGGGM